MGNCYLPGIHSKEGNSISRPHHSERFPKKWDHDVQKRNEEKQIVESFLLLLGAIPRSKRRYSCRITRDISLESHELDLKWVRCANRKSEAGHTEHPNGPHPHQSPNIRLIGRKYKVEGEGSAEEHGGVALHLEHSVEHCSRHSGVLGRGGSPRSEGRRRLLNNLPICNRSREISREGEDGENERKKDTFLMSLSLIGTTEGMEAWFPPPPTMLVCVSGGFSWPLVVAVVSTPSDPASARNLVRRMRKSAQEMKVEEGKRGLGSLEMLEGEWDAEEE